VAVKAALVVPFRFGERARDEAWAWLRARWRRNHPGVQIVVGSMLDPDADWCKAEAVAHAVRRTKADVLVVCDGDMMIDQRAVQHAIRTVEDGRRQWAVPYVQVGRLDAPTTRWLLTHGQLPPVPKLQRHLYDGIRGGGCVVLPRAVYETCPLDRRFVRWGGEDEAWGIALAALYGPPEAVTGVAWHLWHPHAAPHRPRERMPELPESQRLLVEYRHARRNPILIGQLVEAGASPRG